MITMNYIRVPSLHEMAEIKIATEIWKQQDVRDFLKRYHPVFLDYHEAKLLENEVVESVSRLPLPDILRKGVVYFVLPIALQILEWKKCIHTFRYVRLNCDADFFLDKLHWTPQGLVDGKRTVEMLVKDDRLGINRRYELACIYCLEDDIPLLWKKVRNKRRFFNEKDIIMVQEHDLVVFWTYYIKGKLVRLNKIIKKSGPKRSPFQYALERAACYRNKVAMEYFLQRLTPQQRDESLVRCAEFVANKSYNFVHNCDCVPEGCCAHALRFLLSQMNEEQQMEVFKAHPLQVLKSLLSWPWEHFFIPTAKRMLGFLPKEEYESLLQSIVNKDRSSYKICRYEIIFAQLWPLIPESYRTHLIHKSRSFGVLVSRLFRTEDAENIYVIFRHSRVQDRDAIIFSNAGQVVRECLFNEGRWNFLRLIIEDCILPNTTIPKLKNAVRQHITSLINRRLMEESVLKKFYDLLSDIAENKGKKRSLEDSTNPFKRPRRKEVDY